MYNYRSVQCGVVLLLFRRRQVMVQLDNRNACKLQKQGFVYCCMTKHLPLLAALDPPPVQPETILNTPVTMR